MGYRKNTDILKGSMLMVFVGNETNQYPIAFATSHSISFTTNTSEVSTKDHGLYPSVIVNSQSWEVSAENLASADSINQLFTILEDTGKGTPVTLKFAKPGNWEDKGIVGKEGEANIWSVNGTPKGDIIAEGEAYLTSLQLNAPAGDNATISATFTGIGAFTLDKAGASIAGPQGVTGPIGPTGYTGPTGESSDSDA